MKAKPPARRAFLRLSVAMAFAAVAGSVPAHWNPPAEKLVEVDVYDRTSGAALPVYAKDGRSFVVGTPGHEYAVRIRNCTGGRVLAVTSVDGVNVVTGETATPGQSGYVLEPWGSVEIAGWRKSMQQTAAFYFSEHAQSYAARTGRPFDVGVIGVAAFAEKRAPVPRVSLKGRPEGEQAPQRFSAEGSPTSMFEGKREARAQEADARADAPAAPSASEAARDRYDPPAANAQAAAAPMPAAKLGTGHGRVETSHAWRTTFERATSEPGQLVALQYDRHENLVAQGVIPAPRVARTPRPFPGLRFVPDPN